MGGIVEKYCNRLVLHHGLFGIPNWPFAIVQAAVRPQYVTQLGRSSGLHVVPAVPDVAATPPVAASTALATLIGYRDDGRCREPFCNAPARHTDHIVPHRAGGPTTFTNGRATCVRTNQAREMPGWHVRLVHDGHGDDPHTVATTTPTGHTYTSRAGPAR